MVPTPQSVEPSTLKNISAPESKETVSGLIVSLLFWFTLLIEAGLFAAVALAPKLVESIRLNESFDTGQNRLVAIEDQNEQIKRVIDAIKHDQNFAREMTRIEFDAADPSEEIIPVAPSLKLDSNRVEPVVPESNELAAWYVPWLIPLSKDQTLRSSLLATAAVMVIISFTWLQPGTARKLDPSVRASRWVWQSIVSRYAR